jgi:hypothetical protein
MNRAGSSPPTPPSLGTVHTPFLSTLLMCVDRKKDLGVTAIPCSLRFLQKTRVCAWAGPLCVWVCVWVHGGFRGIQVILRVEMVLDTM